MRLGMGSMLMAGLAIGCGSARAQVAMGGGGKATVGDVAKPYPAMERLLAPGKTLSAKQRRDRDEAWRREIRKQLYVPDRPPPLKAEVWSTFSPAEGVLADRVTYETAQGMRVPAIVYRPDPKVAHWKGKLPGVVVVNGHGGDKFSWYAFYSGMMFAKAGAVVVTYDPIGEGERNSKRQSGDSPSPHDRVVDTPHWGQRLAGLMQVDLMQAVSYLQAQPEVDRSRIAAVGYSMGSFVLGITGAIDPRIHAVVLSGGGVYDRPGEYFDSGTLPCQSPPYRALGVLGDRGAVLYALNASRGPMYVMNGDADTVMRMADHPPAWFAEVRARAVDLRGTDKDMFTTVLYPGISHRTSWVNGDGVKWLNAQIHFAFWSTDAKIDAAGTTHILEWEQANGVHVPKNYIREDRETGLRAVGTGLPGIRREDLMVMPAEEWERERDSLTYEGWAAKAHALEGR